MVKNNLNIQLKDLISIGAHLGHNKKYYNSSMGSNIIGHRSGIDILNLEKTIVSLRQVSKILEHLSIQKSNILFINTIPMFDSIVNLCAKISKQSALNGPWVHGTLTNFNVVKPFLKNKKLSFLNKMPDLIFLLNVKKNEKILKEINTVGIPVIVLGDSDININNVTYAIPGNDDSYTTVYFFLMYFALSLRHFYKPNSRQTVNKVLPVREKNSKPTIFKKRYFNIKK